MKSFLFTLFALSCTAHSGTTAPPEIKPFIKAVDVGGGESDPIFQSTINQIRSFPNTDTLAALTSDNTNRIAGFTSESSSVQDINLLGLNGIAISGTIIEAPDGQYAISQPGTNANMATLPARNILGYSQFLYLLEPGANVYRWETLGGGTVSGTGRVLWITDKAFVGNVLNTTNTLSDTIAYTVNGTISGSLTNTGNVRADEIALDIEDDGNVGAIVNRGILSGGKYALRNSGNLGTLINTGSVSGGILNSGIISGDVSLGGAALILAGNKAMLGGTVRGTPGDGSSVSVGDINNTSAFIARNNVNVDNITVTSGSSLTLTPSARWSAANGTVNNGTLTLESGSVLDGPLFQNGVLLFGTDKNASSVINTSLTNKGILMLNPTSTSAGNTLTVNGDYTGLPGSSVSLGSVLGGDDSLTDRLVVTGNTSGTSTLFVTNENGSGAQTLDGIRLISVGGRSDAVFTLGNRVVAGAYDYSLHKGNVSGSDLTGWYLTSMTSVPQIQPEQPSSSQIPLHMYRPEAAAYTANLMAANMLFDLSMRDHSGETRYTDPATGYVRKTHMWMLNLGGHGRSSMEDGQNSTQTNRYVLQLGGDLLQGSTNGKDGVHVGLMGGYGSVNSNSHNSLTGQNAKGSVNGYSAGLYGTWYQNAESKTGAWAETWTQYNWFHNEVSGDKLPVERYNSRGLKASLEGGYAWQIATWRGESGIENWVYLEPHAQVIWSGISAESHKETGGTMVQDTGNDGLTTRLGIRTYLNGKSHLDQDTVREFQPFVEINWLHNRDTYGVRMNGEADSLKGLRDIAELKTGVEGRLLKSLTGAVVFTQQAGEGFRDSQGSLQVSYRF
ncbi:autotransporter outer membrane beta-barrel domain-containing protein [Pantoea stewartii]|uniref:Adhesin autotransporter YdeU n=2 Tax=Pantoea stewartii TaxID=66269 RepID=A0AB34VFE0_9GAMM|nr:autotransporter outer membrane beta-barrel domain-containing protein [Pantoea stewartii]KTS72229.1 adhesin autotransporter YdeU [Pantoea stewartii]KTS97657.1 adhesin autotransporter YdeU [Pantoea stewartii]KTT05818.1 adhesin autotransporter YdeU [Pantoea stewartii]